MISDSARMDLEHPFASEDEADKYILALHDSFEFFLSELWKDRKLDRLSPLSFVELDLANFAAHGPRRRVVLGFRAIGKTTLVAEPLSLFRLFRDPSRKVLLPCKAERAAVETLHVIRAWTEEVWWLRHLMPDKKSRDTTTHFDVAGQHEHRQPSVKALGIDGQLEGNRAHTIIPDDIETKANTITIEARQRLKQQCFEFMNILYNDVPIERGGPIDPTEIVGLGTPKHEESIYADWIRQGFACRAYPIRYPHPNERVLSMAPVLVERMKSGEALPGDPTVPIRYPREEIAIRESGGRDGDRIGRTDFLREYMLVGDLANVIRYPLRLSDLLVMHVPPDQAPVSLSWGPLDEQGKTTVIPNSQIPSMGFGTDRPTRPAVVSKNWAPYTGTKMWIDPSGRGQDHTAWAIISHLHGFYWVHEIASLQGGFEESTLQTLATRARSFGVREIFIEETFTAGAWTKIFQPVIQRSFLAAGADVRYPGGWQAAVTARTTGGPGSRKEDRLCAAIEPLVNAHRVVLDPACLLTSQEDREHEFQYQYTHLTREKDSLAFDDSIDAFGSCLREWESTFRIDPRTAEATEDETRIRQMREALARRSGKRVVEPRFIQHHRLPGYR